MAENRAPTYRDATGLLIRKITLEDVAGAIREASGGNVDGHDVARARLKEGTRSWRPVPEGWERGVARAAAERAEELVRLAVALDPEATALRRIAQLLPQR